MAEHLAVVRFEASCGHVVTTTVDLEKVNPATLASQQCDDCQYTSEDKQFALKAGLE